MKGNTNKRFNNHFTTNPLVIPLKDGEIDEEDIKLLKEITKDGVDAVKEREKKKHYT